MHFSFDQTRPIDVICMGRVAVDLYSEQIHCELSKAETFRKYLGGCAGNIAVGTARLGLTSVMFSCIGQDEMGTFLKETLAQENVGTQLLYETNQHLTGLVLLGINPPHHFPLIFYRNNCADMQLKPMHVKEDVFRESKSLLITGTGLSMPSMQETTQHAIDIAKKVGTAVIIDLDYRPVLWGLTSVGDGETRYQISETVSSEYQKILFSCDLIVGTEEEFCIASGKQALDQAIAVIRHFSSAPLVVKMGEKGCHVYLKEREPPFISRPFSVEVLNVLGAGDAFISGLLRGLLRLESWEQATTYANANGALVVTRHGCAPAMPYFDELQYFIHHYEYDPHVWKKSAFSKLHQENNKSVLISQSGGFSDGLTTLVKIGEKNLDTQMNFHCLKLRMGDHYHLTSSLEAAYLLMTGHVTFTFAGNTKTVKRIGYFEENPIVLHLAKHTKASLCALSDCEILIMETHNENTFEPMLFEEDNLVEIDHRGKNLLNDTSYRIVRTVFDKRNRPLSNLIVGEIITFQGRWSSYPSHYHAQPEIYHYRFSEPQGFAFGENGDDVIKIRHYDTYKITQGQTHAHCTAPGYALYTLWFIRHLDNQAYTTPIFQPQHEWTRDNTANVRAYK